jgi:diacylglycerol kinase family enzyme
MLIPAVTPATPFHVVLNARSGSGDAMESRDEIARIFDAAGKPHRFFMIERPEQVAALSASAVAAAKEEGGAVVVGGGDGTINAVAQAVIETERPFGVIPQGTFNYLSRTYGIPLDSAAAARALLTPRVHPIQVGIANERIFLVNASLGLHPDLLQEREAYTRQFGRNRAVALWAGLATLLKGHRELVLEIEHDDGVEIVRTPTLFIGNNALQLERVGLPEADDVQQDRLAAVMARPVGTGALLWLALRGALGQLGDERNVRNFPFRRLSVRVKGERKTIKLALDGEIVWMPPPVQFTIARRRLMLMVPAEASS